METENLSSFIQPGRGCERESSNAYIINQNENLNSMKIDWSNLYMKQKEGEEKGKKKKKKKKKKS